MSEVRPTAIKGARLAPPRASAMIESLRGIGYTAGTAVADIIDNSIAAGARNVWIGVGGAGSDAYVALLDDGCGMSDAELERAMRLGDRSPLETRDPRDLGRFGLGLKTASFSQARRLTVASRKQNHTSILRWDLDVLANSLDGAWYLLEGPAPQSTQKLGGIDKLSSGTLVLWEVLDRLVPSDSTAEDFLNAVSGIRDHLGMVFHRFISDGSLKLFINDVAVKAWDPFLSAHSKTWRSPDLNDGPHDAPISAQAFVLPHRDHLSPSEYAAASGPEGWNSHQGFFVYRNRRLLLAGGWLGLGRGRRWTSEEPFRLARIRLDLPNAVDAQWKIDVKKASAQPPASLRNRLTHLAEDARERARRVFAYRGRKVVHPGGSPVAQAWQAVKARSGTRYRIDTSHPAIASVLELASSDQLKPELLAMLRVIEETVPVQRIWLDTAENRETPRTGFSGEPPDEVRSVANVMFRSMVDRKGMSVELAKESLLRTEPFDQYPDLISKLGG